MARKLSIVDKSDAEFEIKRNGVEWIDVLDTCDGNIYFELRNDEMNDYVYIKEENFKFIVEAAKELNIDIDVWED